MFSKITDKLRGMVRLETCAAEYTRFPMRFFIEMGRNVPIIIGHSYVSWGTLKAEQNKSRRIRKLTICIGENKGAGSASQ